MNLLGAGSEARLAVTRSLRQMSSQDREWLLSITYTHLQDSYRRRAVPEMCMVLNEVAGADHFMSLVAAKPARRDAAAAAAAAAAVAAGSVAAQQAAPAHGGSHVSWSSGGGGGSGPLSGPGDCTGHQAQDPHDRTMAQCADPVSPSTGADAASCRLES